MDHLKLTSEMINACNPNVVLVEKTVSRDIQECLLSKGITLVFDMKLHRLERIARCTGSPIISPSAVSPNPQLRQCDSFHIEKFSEEHNLLSEGGKKPSKTLMFFEGCPKPLGCTVCNLFTFLRCKRFSYSSEDNINPSMINLFLIADSAERSPQ